MVIFKHVAFESGSCVASVSFTDRRIKLVKRCRELRSVETSFDSIFRMTSLAFANMAGVLFQQE